MLAHIDQSPSPHGHYGQIEFYKMPSGFSVAIKTMTVHSNYDIFLHEFEMLKQFRQNEEYPYLILPGNASSSITPSKTTFKIDYSDPKNPKTIPFCNKTETEITAAFLKEASGSPVTLPFSVNLDPSNPFIAMQRIDSTLFNYMTIENTELMRGLFLQLANKIKEVHKKKIIHRDLKPENILVHSKNGSLNVYIADFGLAIHENNHHSGNNLIGTVLYMPLRLGAKLVSTYYHDYYSFAAIITYYIHNDLFKEMLTLKEPTHCQLNDKIDSYFQNQLSEIENILKCLLRTDLHALDELKDCFENLIVLLGKENSLVKKTQSCKIKTDLTNQAGRAQYE